MERRFIAGNYLVMVFSSAIYVSAIFVTLSYHLEGRLNDSWLVALAAGITLSNHVYFLVRKNLLVWSGLFLAMLGVLSLASFYRGGAFSNGVLWAMLFPFFTFYLVGYRKGFFCNALYIGSLIVITLWQSWTGGLRHSWEFMLTYFFILITLSLLTLIYDRDKARLLDQVSQTSEKYSTLFKHLNYAVVVVSKDLDVLETNEVFIAWFGADAPTVIDSLKQWSHQQKGYLIESALRERTEKSMIGEFDLAGSTRTLRVVAAPIFTKGHLHTTVMVTFEDITSQTKQYEATLEKAVHFESLANLDALTSLFNRRYFEEQTPVLFELAIKHKFPLTILLIDIDYFKQFNDALGHAQGDNALKMVAQTLKQEVDRRRDSFVARYGGEELVVVLQNMNIHEAKQYAEHLQKRISALCIPHPTSNVKPYLTVSIGVSSAHAHAQLNYQKLFDQADLALYHAKGHGRNQVVSYHEARSNRSNQKPEPTLM